MKLRYMLDADILSYASRGAGSAAQNIVSHYAAELCVSALTIAEMHYGATLRRSARMRRWLERFMTWVAVMPFDTASALRFGDVAADLTRRGTPIGLFDTAIAAHALALDLTLVTNNEKHFARIPALRVENWS